MTTEQTYVPRVRQRYLDEVGPQLASEFGHDNRMQWPTLSKIAVNIGLGEAIDNANAMDAATNDLMALTGQRPYVRRARAAISNFKLREGVPIGLALTLRGSRMWDFFDRLVNAALPRVRDFRGVPRPGVRRTRQLRARADRAADVSGARVRQHRPGARDAGQHRDDSANGRGGQATARTPRYAVPAKAGARWRVSRRSPRRTGSPSSPRGRRTAARSCGASGRAGEHGRLSDSSACAGSVSAS